MIVTVVIAVVIVLLILGLYNSIVTTKIRVSEAFSQIDVQLKRRADLIPNLVETVKGYAKHEKEIFEKVTKARSALLGASGVADKADANNQLSKTLKSLIAVAEAYPNLKASDNYKELQEELSDTEDKIAYARQFYNGMVRDYNTKLGVFPGSLFASLFQFKPAEFFGATEAERKPVKVSL